jgi:hypothetical protein
MIIVAAAELSDLITVNGRGTVLRLAAAAAATVTRTRRAVTAGPGHRDAGPGP